MSTQQQYVTPRQAHQAEVANLTADEFHQRLSGRVQLVQRFAQAVGESVKEGDIQPWEYPEIESAIGLMSASVFGVPSINDFSIETLLTPGQRQP